jgi:hypothetical protein
MSGWQNIRVGFARNEADKPRATLNSWCDSVTPSGHIRANLQSSSIKQCLGPNPMLLTILAFCLLFAVFTWAMTKEIRAFYKKVRIAYGAADAATVRPAER